MSDDFLYQVPEVVMFFVLLAAVAVTLELGYRVAGRLESASNEEERSQFSNIQGALLGLFALILGFTFSMSLTRYEHRKEMVVEEANVIGTAALRAEFVEPSQHDAVRDAFKKYIDVRLEASRRPNVASPERAALDEEANALQERIWSAAVESARADPRSVPRSLFMQSVNELIDTKEAHDAALANHVPTSVLLLLFVFAVLVTGVVGYGAGLARTRPISAWAALALLTSGVMVLIVDLDRPQRGLVVVSQRSLENVQRSLTAER